MSHGYLIAQFFGRLHGEDEYGAPLALRARRWRPCGGRGELAVGVRLSADELAPEGAGRRGLRGDRRELCGTGLADFASLASATPRTSLVDLRSCRRRPPARTRWRGRSQRCARRSTSP